MKLFTFWIPSTGTSQLSFTFLTYPIRQSILQSELVPLRTSCFPRKCFHTSTIPFDCSLPRHKVPTVVTIVKIRTYPVSSCVPLPESVYQHTFPTICPRHRKLTLCQLRTTGSSLPSFTHRTGTTKGEWENTEPYRRLINSGWRSSVNYVRCFQSVDFGIHLTFSFHSPRPFFVPFISRVYKTVILWNLTDYYTLKCLSTF